MGCLRASGDTGASGGGLDEVDCEGGRKGDEDCEVGGVVAKGSGDRVK
jgi:hypothetical protein